MKLPSLVFGKQQASARQLFVVIPLIRDRRDLGAVEFFDAGEKRALAGLGRSAMAEKNAIRDLAEACDYLRDPLLRARLGPP